MDGVPAHVLRALPAPRLRGRGAGRRDHHHPARPGQRAARGARPFQPGDSRRRPSPTRLLGLDRSAHRRAARRSSTASAPTPNEPGARDVRRTGPTNANGWAPTWPSGSGATANRCATGGAVVISSERRFGDAGDVTIALPSGRALALKGSIDRVDVAADGTLYVTDYKTGGDRNFTAISDDDPTASGTRLQLPSYAAAALARRRTARRGGPRRVLVLRGRQVQAHRIHVHARDLGRGGAVARPRGRRHRVRAATRRNRNAPHGGRSRRASYCEPDKLGTAERWGEWDRKRHDPRLQRWFADPDADTEEAAPSE